jgi:hypothetical protein
MWSGLLQIKRKEKACKIIITQILSAEGRHPNCVLVNELEANFAGGDV